MAAEFSTLLEAEFWSGVFARRFAKWNGLTRGTQDEAARTSAREADAALEEFRKRAGVLR